MALDMPGACRHRPVLVRNCIDYKSFWSNMLLRGTGIIVGLVASFILCGGYMLGSSVARDTVFKAASTLPEATLALAPLSLGNPFAAKGPETSPPLFSQTHIEPAAAPRNPVIEQTFKVRKGDIGHCSWPGRRQPRRCPCAMKALRKT